MKIVGEEEKRGKKYVIMERGEEMIERNVEKIGKYD